MRSELIDGIPTRVPRNGIRSYAAPAQDLIRRCVRQQTQAAYCAGYSLHRLSVTRVLNEADPQRVRLYFATEIARA